VKANDFSLKINELLGLGRWEEARVLLEQERARRPRDHWVVTQLGVTLYEQSRYREALALFLESRELLDDCPLTLWNLAGTLDALGRYSEAVQIYAWLLRSEVTASEHPCWESAAWTSSLRTDCAYRLGVCYRHMKQKATAASWFQRYIDLLLAGFKGSYSVEDVAAQLRKLRATKDGPSQAKLRKLVRPTLRLTGIGNAKDHRKSPPKFTDMELLPAKRDTISK